MINAATLSFNTEYYLAPSKPGQLEEIANTFCNVNFSKLDDVDFVQEMQRIDSEYYFRQGLDDFFIGIKEAVFEKKIPSVCGRLDYFDFDSQKWLEYCRQIYERYYTPHNIVLVYYGLADEKAEFDAVDLPNVVLNNDKVKEAYMREIHEIKEEKLQTNKTLFPHFSSSGKIIGFDRMFTREGYCVFFLPLNEESVFRLSQFYILVEYFLSLQDFADDCEAVNCYHYIENKVYDPYIQFVISFIPSVDEKKQKNREMNAVGEIESFMANLEYFYQREFQTISLANKSPIQFYSNSNVQQLRWEARTTLWMHHKQITFKPIIFSEADAGHIKALFADRMYLVNVKRDVKEAKEAKEVKKDAKKRGGERKEEEKVSNIYTFKIKDQNFDSHFEELKTKFAKTSRRTRKTMKYVSEMATMCECAKGEMAATNLVEAEDFVLIFIPVIQDKDDAHNANFKLDAHLGILANEVSKWVNLIGFNFLQYNYIENSFNIIANADDMPYIVSFIVTLLEEIYNGSFESLKNIAQMKDDYQTILEDYTMFQIKNECIEKGKIPFQFSIIPRGVLLPKCQLLRKNAKATERQKDCISKVFSLCEETLKSRDFFFNAGLKQDDFHMALEDPEKIFDEVEAKSGLIQNKIYDGSVKLLIREMYDHSMQNKFKVMWFFDEETDQGLVWFFTWFFTVFAQYIFFDEYYYLDQQMIQGAQEMILFELGINSRSNKQKIFNDFLQIFDVAISLFNQRDCNGQLMSLFFVYPGRLCKPEEEKNCNGVEVEDFIESYKK